MKSWLLNDFFTKLSRESDISRLMTEHQAYRASTLNMIPSENLISPAVSMAISSDLEARYNLPCEGKLDGEIFDNDYRGSKYLNEIELVTKKKLKKLFDVKFVDVRPLAGHLAAMITLGSLIKAGNKISVLPFKAGGYDGYVPRLLPSLLNLDSVDLPFDYKNWDLDYKRLSEHLKKEQPAAIILGHSFPLFPFDIKRIKEIIGLNASKEPLLLLDASHILGLIAGKAYPDPIQDGVDLFYGSTHKTFFGPQRGIILTNREDLFEKIDTDFFWKWQDNCHWGSIAALGIAAEELQNWGEEYASLTVKLSQRLAKSLMNEGLPIRCPERGFTQTHQVLVNGDLIRDKWNFGLVRLAEFLEKSGMIIDNAGRFGTQELARSGVKVSDMDEIVNWIVRALKSTDDDRKIIKEEIKEFKKHVKIQFTFQG